MLLREKSGGARLMANHAEYIPRAPHRNAKSRLRRGCPLQHLSITAFLFLRRTCKGLSCEALVN